MQQVLFTIVTDADFAAILVTDGPLGTNKIEGYYSMGGYTDYITENLARPGTSVYACMRMPDGSFIVSQSKQPALTPLHTFLGWSIPA